MEDKVLKLMYTDWDGKLHIEDVAITKETEKQYQISSKHAGRCRLGKNELNTMIYERLFTFDLQKGIEVWNEYHQKLADNYKEKSEKHAKMVVTGSL